MLRFVILAAVAASAFAACSNKCSGHGTCGAQDSCVCNPRWVGADCSARECPKGKSWVASTATTTDVGPAMGAIGGNHAYTECSSKGSCDSETGMCTCYAGYTGLACSRQTCPGGCSGHGRCVYNDAVRARGTAANAGFELQAWDSDMTRQCACDRGWQGVDCNSRICPVGNDPLRCTTADSVADQRSIQLITVRMPGDVTTASSWTTHIALTFTDMFNGKYTTRPILLNGAAPTDTDAHKAYRCAGVTDGTACANKEWLADMQFVGRCTDATKTTEATCLASTAGECIKADGTVEASKDSTTCGGTVATNKWYTAEWTYEDFDANRIRDGLQSLPNFAIPKVNVTNYGFSGTSWAAAAAGCFTSAGVASSEGASAACASAGHTWYAAGWTYAVTFSDPATPGPQNLLGCEIASSQSDFAGVAPRMKKNADGGAALCQVAHSTRDVTTDAVTTASSAIAATTCSSRGICDTATGLCTCFGGYAGEDCSKQTIYF